MSDAFANIPDIGALAAQDAAVGLDPSVNDAAEQLVGAEQLPEGQVPYDPTDANQALAESLTAEEIAQLSGAQPEAVPGTPVAPQAAAPAPQAPVAPQVDPVVAALMQQNQAIMQYMQTAEQRSHDMVRSFKEEVSAFRPKEPEKPKTELELFQDETLAKAREAVRQAEVAPLQARLEALEQAAKRSQVQALASQRMNEAKASAQQAFGESIDSEALPAVQELTLSLAYGYEIPTQQAAQLAKQLVSKAVDAHLRSLKKQAQATVARQPVKAPPVPQSTIAAGGTGGVAGKLPAWFTQE
jgi:hypothetical protein